MYIDFSSIFHRSSKDLADKGRVYIPHDDSLWPKEWTTVYYKEYPRTKKIPLARTSHRGKDFFEVLAARRSRRNFAKKPANFENMSALLQHACGVTHVADGNTTARAYASAGARFPLEVYPVVIRGSEEIPAGVYHYSVQSHELDVLWERSFTNEDIRSISTYPWVQDASFMFIITGIFWRNQIKYGERGFRYVLMETGHLSENVYLTAEALGMKCSAMTGLHEPRIEDMLEIDGVTESVLHSLILE